MSLFIDLGRKGGSRRSQAERAVPPGRSGLREPDRAGAWIAAHHHVCRFAACARNGVASVAWAVSRLGSGVSHRIGAQIIVR
ncbi:hypothetical protein [Caballeronia novacaledonica]|uniref:hypothetical protein n=1 Tax=Caballeronia novacaledonica TaxID=1544861 RepID=UPI0011B254B4|nr:hypothetical protein [Caballeronia novacaledonica]